MKQTSVTNSRTRLSALLCVVLCIIAILVFMAPRASAHGVQLLPGYDIGIPYYWFLELNIAQTGTNYETTDTFPDHVGAWSWDEDTFPETARGWTHTSRWIQLRLAQDSLFTITVESLAGAPWPSPEDPLRVAGTNLFPSFTLYKSWDLDEGTPDQFHTFNNRGNIEWAEDVIYLDHAENTTEHTLTRTWLLPKGNFTINLGGNSPATIAEGRQGYKATFTANESPVTVSNAVLTSIEFSDTGIPYGIGVILDDRSKVQTLPDHVSAWSWDEDTFPETTRGWTHTSKFLKLDLLKPAKFTLTLSNLANVPWPSPEDTNRLAGTNLYPSFTIYKGWDTDGGTPDQLHTFNNRGNIEWAEDVTYMDHLENTNSHTATRTWNFPAGHYTINLGGNSPATIAEGRQGYRAVLQTEPLPVLDSELTNGQLRVRWSASNTNTLLEATSPVGPWTPVDDTSPVVHGWKNHTIVPTNEMHLFRLQ